MISRIWARCARWSCGVLSSHEELESVVVLSSRDQVVISAWWRRLGSESGRARNQASWSLSYMSGAALVCCWSFLLYSGSTVGAFLQWHGVMETGVAFRRDYVLDNTLYTVKPMGHALTLATCTRPRPGIVQLVMTSSHLTQLVSPNAGSDGRYTIIQLISMHSVFNSRDASLGAVVTPCDTIYPRVGS